jgi:hypothetical protein
LVLALTTLVCYYLRDKFKFGCMDGWKDGKTVFWIAYINHKLQKTDYFMKTFSPIEPDIANQIVNKYESALLNEHLQRLYCNLAILWKSCCTL